MHYYTPIPSEEVSEATRHAAEGMLRAACADLRLEGIRLRWFRPETEEEREEREAWRDLELGVFASEATKDLLSPAAIEVAYRVAQTIALWQREKEIGDVVRLEDKEVFDGRYHHDRPGEVWARADLDAGRVAHVTAHELRHAWRHRRYGKFLEEYTAKTGRRPNLHDSEEGDCEGYARHAVAALPWRPT